MRSKLKTVFDTNIYISAIIFGGVPESCLDVAINDEIELYTTRAILLELANKLTTKFLHTEEDFEDILKGFSKFVKIIEPKVKVDKIKIDPQDNKILEAALEAKADYIVSGDKKHLLSLGNFRNIPIISAKQFLDIFYKKSK